MQSIVSDIIGDMDLDISDVENDGISDTESKGKYGN